MADDDIRLSLLADFRVAPSTDDPRGAVAGNSVAVVHKHGVVCVGAGSDLVCVDASVLATAAWARYDESRRPGGSKRREGAPPPALARATLMGACACCASASNANVVAAATGSDVTLFAVERGPSLRHVRTQHVTGVTSLTVSGDGVWVAASSPTSTVVFRVDGGGDVDLAAGHAAFCGTRLAVACANSVKAYALTNEVWREEGCVTPDGDAFGDDDPRTAHFVRWLDGDRVLAGFRHATDDALARCVVVDVSTCTVTTYAADLGDGVVAFFDREKEGAPHAFFGEVVRAGLAVVACNLSRDVGVIREDPEVSGAYYLHEAYDEASLVCQTPCQSHAGDERETLVAGLGVLARGVTRPAPPVDPSVPAPPDAPPAPLVLLLSTAGLLSCYALADDEKPAAQMAVEPPPASDPPAPAKASSKLSFGGATPVSGYPPMPTKAPSKLPFGAPAPAAAAKSVYPPMPTKAPSKLPFGGAKPTSASPPMPATAPSQVPAEAPPPTDLPPGWTMQIPKDEEEAEKWRAIREMEGAMARMRRELKVAQAAVAPHLAQGREDARKERALLAEARTTALGLEAQEREFGEARAALLGSVETVQRQNEETRANLDIAEGMMGDCTDPLLKAKAKAWEEVLEHQELDTASQQRLEKLTKLSSDVADKLAEVSLVNSHREALAKHKAPPMTTSFFGSPRDAPSFGTAKVKTETSDEAAFLRRVRATYEQTLDLQERIIPSLNERWDAACVERDRLMETKRAIPDRVQQAIDRDVLEAKGREPPEMEPWEQAFVRMCEENTPPIVTDCRPQSQKSRPLVPQRRATTEEPLSTHVEGLKGASAVPWAKVHREAVHASKLQAPRTPTSDLAASSAALGVSALSFTSPEAPAGPTFGKATPAPAPAAVGFGAAFGAALESTPAPAPAAVGFGGFGLGLDSPAPAPMPAKAPGALPFGTPAPAPAAPKASPFSNAFKLEGLEAALEAKTAATGATPAAAPAAPAFGTATPAPAPAAPAAALATTPFGTSGTFGAAAPAPPPVPTGFGAPAAGDPRARVVVIYQRCNPSKLGEVDKLLAKYAGKEAELVLRLQKKYAAQLGGTAGALGSPAAAAPVFGSPAAASPFGSAPAPAASPFGTAAAVSPFGAPAPAASPFGTAPAPAPFGGSTFGSPAALGTSTFGGTSTLGAAPAFGSPAALGAAPAFGSPAALGAAPFGGAATDARSKVVEIYQRCNPTKLGEVDKLLAKYAGREAELVARLQKKYAAQLSGGATFGGAAAAPSAGFGGMAAAPSARFGGFGGGAAAPSGFGQAALLGGGSAFGGASPGGSFGAAAPAFGQPAAFGGAAPQAGFGAPSAFGQPQPAFGQTASPGAGFGQTAAPSGFGGFGGAPSPGFGGQPQQAAFGQPQQAAFGQPQQAAFGGGGFGAPAPAPAFGQPQQGASTFGRSFTQFRG